MEKIIYLKEKCYYCKEKAANLFCIDNECLRKQILFCHTCLLRNDMCTNEQNQH